MMSTVQAQFVHDHRTGFTLAAAGPDILARPFGEALPTLRTRQSGQHGRSDAAYKTYLNQATQCLAA